MAQAWAAMALADARPLDVFCWVTAWIGPLFTLCATCVSWYHRALGGGGRRPEPTIAALMGSLCWLAYGYRVFKDTIEPVAVNAWGGTFQAVYLFTFLCLCTGEERRRAIKPLTPAVIYVALLLSMGRVDSDSYRVLCTIAGCVSAAAPLLTYWLLNENTLPPWVMSAFSVVHCFAWCIRGVTKPVPQHPDLYMDPDLYMATQNGIGAFCSSVLLLLAWFLPDALAPPMEEDLDLLAALINPDVLAHPLFPPRPPPLRRRSTGVDVDTPAARRHYDPPPPRRRSTGADA